LHAAVKWPRVCRENAGHLPDAVIVIITGHNEFEYAQQALKLGVFDYLLKPVSKEQLYKVLQAVKERLLQHKYMDWATRQLSTHLPQVKERFLNSWVESRLTEEEIREQLGYLQVPLHPAFSIVLVKVLDRIQWNGNARDWDRGLLLFAVQNVVDEVVRQRGDGTVFRDSGDHIVAIAAPADTLGSSELASAIVSAVDNCLKTTIIALQADNVTELTEVPHAYRRLLQEAAEESKAVPIVVLAKKYIRDNYHKEELTLTEAADALKISPSYLSRLLRQETGLSFIDCLTQTRIKQAALLLRDPAIKIFEVAGSVGYNGQHYFSIAFKKEMGVSPAEYRKGGTK
jgi:two-component system response regulator YesN